MKKHLQYLWYVTRHKWFVFIECLKLGVPIHLAILHDWQKFTPTEWSPYALSFYGPWGYKDRPQWLKDDFDKAWLHHQHRGPHHWQYWILRNDDGNIVALEMPNRYRLEMLADWRGAGRAINGKDDTVSWYLKNRDRMYLHYNTQNLIEQSLGVDKKEL
jgi:hypothetical protein